MTRSARARAAAVLPLCLLVAGTAASTVQREQVVVDMTGVVFALEVAGSAEPGWRPTEVDWRSGGEPLEVDVDDPVPASQVDLRVAVRNTAGTAAGVVLSLRDPDPTGPEDLFEALHVEVSEDGVLLGEGTASAVAVPLPGDLAAARVEERVVDLTIHLPITGDRRWADARTGLQVVVDGTSR
ncbi:hypothetical protein [Cellulomonas triticagri]|uniref:hypothetical protein n=1 Tax=Cellulomonas triticagri TaxID=2483352 RepID=UPI0011C34CDA|nr:hypothetical protein [Cellulomonas triticagri]